MLACQDSHSGTICFFQKHYQFGKNDPPCFPFKKISTFVWISKDISWEFRGSFRETMSCEVAMNLTQILVFDKFFDQMVKTWIKHDFRATKNRAFTKRSSKLGLKNASPKKKSEQVRKFQVQKILLLGSTTCQTILDTVDDSEIVLTSYSSR